jgi:antibiotic biosynthesis monooxygenase (ABM) superfamily enzyme
MSSVGVAGALFIVKTTITADEEAAFNRWYDEEHVPGMTACPGVLNGRRFRQLSGDDGFQYMTMYEFADRKALSSFFKSDNFKALLADYQTRWPAPSSQFGASTFEAL